MKLLSILCVALLGVAFSTVSRADMLFVGTMSGANEVPANGSTATGFTSVLISGDTMTVHVDWSGLTGGTASAAHIHCCTPVGGSVGVAVGFSGFPASTSGTFDKAFNLLDASIYTSAFLTNFGGGTAAGARDALIAGLSAGTAYSNIHDSTFGSGEIRANLAPVPLPAAAWLLMSGLFGLGSLRKKFSR